MSEPGTVEPSTVAAAERGLARSMPEVAAAFPTAAEFNRPDDRDQVDENHEAALTGWLEARAADRDQLADLLYSCQRFETDDLAAEILASDWLAGRLRDARRDALLEAADAMKADTECLSECGYLTCYGVPPAAWLRARAGGGTDA